MNEFKAKKLADDVFMTIPASIVQNWKERINSVEPYERYKVIIDIYERGFIDSIKLIKENEKCQKNLQKIKRQLQENL